MPPSIRGLADDLRIHGELPLQAELEWLTEPTGQMTGGSPGNPWPWINDQRDHARKRWEVLQREARQVGREIARLRAELVPRSFYALWAILTLLLLAGVSTPMLFLSSQGAESKVPLLVIFTVLASSLLAFYGYELHRLRRADHLENELM